VVTALSAITNRTEDPDEAHDTQLVLLSAASQRDHLIGAGEERGRDFDAERFGGLHIDVHLDFRGLLDRQIAFLP
jgi:hypothetical protein